MPGVFLNENSINIVISKFSLLSTVDDLAALLNWIEKKDTFKKSTEKLKPIDSKLLHFLAKTKDSRYSHFNILKKSGNQREIKTPDEVIKRIQRLLNCLLQIIFAPKAHYNSNGFLYGRDIIRNAKPNVNKTYVLNCDIKDFFPSINFRRVKTVLELAPFKLTNGKENIAFLIANLCIYQDSLPQGAPTSPLMSNIVTQRLDRKLNKYGLSRKVKYSRYADDLTFSSNRNLFDRDFIKKVNDILIEENFQLNEEKTRMKSDMERQQVTGLVVNERINVKREYLQMVRAMLNNWEKGSLEFAKRRFKKHQPLNKKEYDFREVLSGNVSFIGNVRGKDDSVFKKLNIQLKMLLLNRTDYSFVTNENVKKRLTSDNLKMEKILMDKIHLTEDKFIAFCTSAFHQVENLLNYYYWRRFPDFPDLLEFLLQNNPRFKKRFRDLENAKKNFKKNKRFKYKCFSLYF
jgi:RNA-directed DNA polymerase